MCFQKASVITRSTGLGSGSPEILGGDSVSGVAGAETWLHWVEEGTRNFKLSDWLCEAQAKGLMGQSRAFEGWPLLPEALDCNLSVCHQWAGSFVGVTTSTLVILFGGGSAVSRHHPQNTGFQVHRPIGCKSLLYVEKLVTRNQRTRHLKMAAKQKWHSAGNSYSYCTKVNSVCKGLPRKEQHRGSYGRSKVTHSSGTLRFEKG